MRFYFLCSLGQLADSCACMPESDTASNSRSVMQAWWRGQAGNWLALCACACTSMLSVGSVCTLGVYYDYIRLSMHQSHFATSFLFSLSQAVMQLSGLVVGPLLKRMNEQKVIMIGGLLAASGLLLGRLSKHYWQLLLSIGLITGLGQGFAFVTAYIAASFIFDVRKHHVAVSFANTGGGIGMFGFPLIYEFIIEKYEWQNSLLIASGIALHICVCGALMNTSQMRAHKVQMQRVSDNDEKAAKVRQRQFCANVELWKTSTFYILLGNTFSYCVGYSITFTFLYPHLLQQGVSKQFAAGVFSAYGIASLIGRVAAGLFNNRRLLKRWTVYAVAHCFLGIGIMVLAQLDQVNAYFYIIPVVVMGFSNGLQDTLLCCVCLDVLGPEKLSDGFSILVASWGLGSLTGATVGGLIRDQFTSYVVPITVAAMFNLLAALVLSPLKFVNKYCETHLNCVAGAALSDPSELTTALGGRASMISMHDMAASSATVRSWQHIPDDDVTKRSLATKIKDTAAEYSDSQRCPYRRKSNDKQSNTSVQKELALP